MVQWRESIALSKSKAVEQAVTTVHGTVQSYVGKESLVPPSGEKQAAKAQFADDKARWGAALERANAVQNDSEGELKNLAIATGGRAQLGLKDFAGAETTLAAFQNTSKDSLLNPIITENRGRAAEAVGKLEAASKHYTELCNSSNLYYRVRGNMLLGDLYNPNMGEAKGKDGSKAKKFYTSALAVLVPAEGQVVSTSMRALRAEIHRRHALIE
jgi:hypothetical protein